MARKSGMINLLKTIFKLNVYRTPQQRERAMMLYASSSLLMLGYSIFLVAFPASFVGIFAAKGLERPDLAAGAFAAVFFILGLSAILLARRGQLEIGNYAVLLMLALGVGGIGVVTAFSSSAGTMPLLTLIFLGGLLNRQRGLLVATLLAIGIYLLGVTVGTPSPGNPVPTVTTIVGNLLNFGAGAGIAYLFVRLARY